MVVSLTRNKGEAASGAKRGSNWYEVFSAGFTKIANSRLSDEIGIVTAKGMPLTVVRTADQTPGRENCFQKSLPETFQEERHRLSFITWNWLFPV